MNTIEIFGIDESQWRCPSCVTAKRICEEGQVQYTFTGVIERGEDGMPIFDVDQLRDIAERAGFKTLRITYPVIFINNELCRLKDFRQKLFDLGYDVDVF